MKAVILSAIYLAILILITVNCSTESTAPEESTLYDWNYISGDSTVMLITNVTATDTSILIEWLAFGERQNFAYYDIQYRGVYQYQTLGSESGHGSTTDTLNYSFYSVFNTPNSVRFRIKPEYLDGSFERMHIFDVLRL